MKMRFFLTALCLCIGLSAMAQRHGNRANRGGQQQQRTPQSMDMVVDTAIINSMELEPEVVAQVLELQAEKAQELKVKLIQMAQNRQQGQQMTPEDIAAMREQIEEFKFEYRMKLRKVLGVENYINYLEKQVDKRPAMPAGMPAGMPGGMGAGMQRRMGGMNGGMNGNMGGMNGNMGGMNGGWGGNEGGFEGGNGGGFGDAR